MKNRCTSKSERLFTKTLKVNDSQDLVQENIKMPYCEYKNVAYSRSGGFQS